MLILIFFWLAHTFSATLSLQEYVFSVNDVPHDSEETEFGRHFSISHYKYRGSFSVMSCMEMCCDRHDQERKISFSFRHYVHYTMIKWKKVFFTTHYVHYAIIKRQKRFFFHLLTTFTTPWSREKKVFFHLVTTFTTP